MTLSAEDNYDWKAVEEDAFERYIHPYTLRIDKTPNGTDGEGNPTYLYSGFLRNEHDGEETEPATHPALKSAKSALEDLYIELTSKLKL